MDETWQDAFIRTLEARREDWRELWRAEVRERQRIQEEEDKNDGSLLNRLLDSIAEL